MQIKAGPITPEMAKKLLENNRTNRRFRPRWARALASRMARGEWRLTHQGIAISKTGAITDGQHRLAAIQIYGQPVMMMVARDVPEDTFGVLDQGLRRSVEDHFGGKKELIQPASFLSRIVYGPSASIQQIFKIHRALGAVARPAAKIHEAWDLFVRAVFVFDRSKATLAKISVKDPEMHLAEVRRDVLELVEALPDVEP